MSDQTTKPRVLGKGLSALISEHQQMFARNQQTKADQKQVELLPVNHLEPGMMQPRKIFNDEAIQELSESIEAHGVLQPIIVREIGVNRYEIIAGERRWRASQRAGLTEVPVLIVTLTDKQAIEYALIENIQRQDLSVIEEAECYKRLVEEFEYSQELLAKQLGKSRSHITNLLRLNMLPGVIKTMVNNKQLTMGHARALLVAEDPEALANIVIERGLNVRETEKLVQKGKPSAKRTKRRVEIDPEIQEIATQMTGRIGVPVCIKPKSQQKGEVVIQYRTLPELDLIIQSF